MLYLYDKAIVDDLQNSFNPDSVDDPVVKVFDPESITALVAQLKEDAVTLPVVAITRDTDSGSIDPDRSNFTRLHSGVVNLIDPETNMLYREKAIPIRLSYAITVLTSNTADMDELIRELMFHYTQMYYLQIVVPYEHPRKLAFGVVLDENAINRQSGSSEYMKSGQLYQTILKIRCEGAVLLHNTPQKLRNLQYKITEDRSE